MNATLTFNLPEDRTEFKVACEAMEWKLAMVDIATWLRDHLKYGHDFGDADRALEAVRNELQGILDGYNLELLD